MILEPITLAGLQTPPLCELVVGGEPQCWSEGHCLLIDDSFLHTVSHKGWWITPTECANGESHLDSLKKKVTLDFPTPYFHFSVIYIYIFFYKGPPDAGPRVILSVDVWHPNVAAAERQALDFMFSPDLWALGRFDSTLTSELCQFCKMRGGRLLVLRPLSMDHCVHYPFKIMVAIFCTFDPRCIHGACMKIWSYMAAINNVRHLQIQEDLL